MLLFFSFVVQVYREIRQALVDMETMFALQSVKASIVDAPDAKPLELTQGGNIDFEDVCFSFKERNILKGAVRNTIGTLAAGLASGWITRERRGREKRVSSSRSFFGLTLLLQTFRIPAGKSVAIVGASGSGSVATDGGCIARRKVCACACVAWYGVRTRCHPTPSSLRELNLMSPFFVVAVLLSLSPRDQKEHHAPTAVSLLRPQPRHHQDRRAG